MSQTKRNCAHGAMRYNSEINYSENFPTCDIHKANNV